MRISMNNNPIDKLSCIIYNKFEDFSRIHWLMGKHKKIECRICRATMDSWKDTFSPMQCGWKQINKYIWICHQCLDHRDFTPYIKQIDEEERRLFEEHSKRIIEKNKGEINKSI